MADQPTGNTEPVITAQITTLIGLTLSAVGWDLAGDNVGRIASAVVGLLITLVSAWAARSKVTPTVKLDAATDSLRAVVDEVINRPIADVTATFNDAEVEAIAAPAPTPGVDALRALAADLPPMPRRVGLVDPQTTDDILAAKFGPVG